MANITKVYLLNVPLESDYKNTLYFSGKDDQTSYFQSKIKKSYTDFSYQRKDNVIRLPEQYDDVLGCNYVMYQNSAYSNKWFYAFITDVTYINDGRTDITIETDVLQTWMFDYTIKDSFVEREHVTDDTVGANTFPEQLETGEYICNGLSRDQELREYVYVITVTEWTPIDGESNPDKPLATNFGGVFSAGGAYVCENMNEVVSIINLYSEGKIEAVTGVYMIPKKIIKREEGLLQYKGQSEPVVYEHSFEKQTTLDGYTPKNKKLLCFPYNYILNSNNAGQSNIVYYEHFSGDKCTFEIEGVPTIGGSIKCVPANYKGYERIQEEGIMCGKFPTLSWSNDLYTNWITQNAVNIGVGVASSAVSLIGGIALMATGGGALAGGGMVVSGALGIAQTLGQVYEHSLTPNSAQGNINSGDINTSYKMNTFYFYKMSIKKEYARIIDEYFTMFGYKVCRVKKPNKNHRARFWYTKTRDVNIDGAIPNKDMQEIKNCYNNGVTFWKNAADINNYSVDNGIV